MGLHELSSIMLYIHPPIAIAGHILIFIFTFFLIINSSNSQNKIKHVGILAWLFTFLGLITGIIWAQLAWNSFWSLDPKETMTLILFSTFSTSLLFFFENRRKTALCFSVISCVLVIITILISFILAGLHSFI